MSLRERKKTSARTAMRHAAVRLFTERGFANVSVDEIAQAADVSRSTFFRYFGSKEAVLFSEFDDSGGVFLRELLERPPDESPWKAYEEALIAVVVDSNARSTPVEQRMFEELLRTDPALSARRLAEIDRWRDLSASAFATRAGRTEPTSEDRLAAATCMAIVDEITDAWRRHSDVDAIGFVRDAFARARAIASS